MVAVYGGECVVDDYIDGITPETPVIRLSTESDVDEISTSTTEKNVIKEEVETVTEEINGSGEGDLEPNSGEGS